MTDPIEATTSQMPEATAGAIEPDKTSESKGPGEHSTITDRDGNTFDPALHESKPDGSPRLSAKGRAMRRRGRKAGKAYDTPAGSTVRAGGPQTGGADSAGRAAADATIMLGLLIGGAEWLPPDWRPDGGALNEHGNLSLAYSRYFAEKDITDVPPGLALSMAIAAYAGPRLFLPQTKTRLQKAKEWAIGKYIRLRYGKANARTDNGDDSERENEHREGVSEAVS